jgi:hypothetical protein
MRLRFLMFLHAFWSLSHQRKLGLQPVWPKRGGKTQLAFHGRLTVVFLWVCLLRSAEYDADYIVRNPSHTELSTEPLMSVHEVLQCWTLVPRASSLIFVRFMCR